MSERRRNSKVDPSPSTDGWWKEVIAGEVAPRHPVHGDELKVKLTDGRLILSGEVPSRRDRDQLVREARARLGNGLHSYDASGLKIRPKDERPGVLAQTLMAAFAHRDTANVALEFFLEHMRSKPMRTAVIDRHTKLDEELPPELAAAARKQLDRGMILVAVEVDETEAFQARSVLEEDTRSAWTVAAPPHVIAKGRR